jgi:hypothetical protein
MRIRCWFLFVLAAIVTTGCDQSLSSVAGPSPNLEPTFSSIQANIFEATDAAGRAACINCHTNVGHPPAGGLNLVHGVAYDQLVNVASRGKATAVRVIPGDSENSYIVLKLEGSSGIVGQRMPFSGAPFLTNGQMLILKRWIAIGAPRN